MKKILVSAFVLLATPALADESAAIPICDRVAVSFRADSSVDPDKLKGARSFMLRKLADRGYSAKYVSFYAPGEAMPESRESEILAEAGDGPRILVEIDHTDMLLTTNLGLRIYKINPKPPYDALPYVNANAQIGPISVLGPRLKAKFRKLLNSSEMMDCETLAGAKRSAR